MPYAGKRNTKIHRDLSDFSGECLQVVLYLEAWVVLDSKNVFYDHNSYLGLLWQIFSTE